MITLKRDGKVMEVATELQASVFIKHGYVRVCEPSGDAVEAEPEQTTAEAGEKPARRRRRPKTDTVE